MFGTEPIMLAHNHGSTAMFAVDNASPGETYSVGVRASVTVSASAPLGESTGFDLRFSSENTTVG